MNKTFIVPEFDINKRLDHFLSENIIEKSRNMLQKLIESGYVTVNNKIEKSNYKTKLRDIISVDIPKNRKLELQGEDIPLDILYEDDDLIVINKPQNLVVHPAPGHYEGTLVNALLNHCGDSLSGINGVLRPGIVHRIDKDTSGILIAAKNDKAHSYLSEQFSAHTITRKYHAIVFGNIAEDSGTINKPIGRDIKDRKKMAVNYKNGKNAVTNFKVLHRFNGFTLIEAVLETGRTHQIRVHMSDSGHPLLGDKIYGREKQPYKLEGQALHAKILGFIHPKTKEYMEFESELPEYFQKLICTLKQK